MRTSYRPGATWTRPGSSKGAVSAIFVGETRPATPGRCMPAPKAVTVKAASIPTGMAIDGRIHASSYRYTVVPDFGIVLVPPQAHVGVEPERREREQVDQHEHQRAARVLDLRLLGPRRCHDAFRTTSTGHVACARTFSDTLPSSSRFNGPRPRAPTTMRSAALASRTITSAGRPAGVTFTTLRTRPLSACAASSSDR